ncbi:MAG: DMT family transporter [Candidatus Aminicenantales bacterium]
MADVFASVEKLSHFGEILALSSAILWAVSVILFRIIGKTVSPVGMNLLKNVFSIIFLLLTILALHQPLFPPLPWQSYGLLILSGMIGIGLSDTLFFSALNLLGAELVAIVDCSYSPFIIGLSFLFLGERMNGIQIFGVILTISAVALITHKKTQLVISRPTLFLGISLGLLSMFFTAVGVVMIKPLLAHTSLFWASLFRMIGGFLSLGIYLALNPKRQSILKPLCSPQTIKLMIPASFLGGYLALVAWLGGMKYTEASVASAVNQLNTIFIFILGAIFLKEKITPIKIIAILFAFTGAFLVSFFNS